MKPARTHLEICVGDNPREGMMQFIKTLGKFYRWLGRFGLLVTLSIAPAYADFSGSYAISSWIEQTTASTPSLWNTGKVPSSVALQGDISSTNSSDSMTHIANGPGTVQFDWAYNAAGWFPNLAGYMVNGVKTPLTDASSASQSGTGVSFSVKAGDTFGFYIIATADNSPGPTPQVPPTFTLSNFSAPSSSTTGLPSAPTVNRIVPSNNEATVAFDPPRNDGGSPITGYVVTANPGGVQAQGLSSPVYVAGLTNQTTTFTVAAFNANGVGPTSPPVTSDMNPPASCGYSGQPGCNPAAPAITAVTPGNGQATVVFNPVSPMDSGGSPIVSYTATANPGGASASSASSPIVVTGLTNGANYTFTVTATNADKWGKDSSPSANVLISPIPSPVINSLVAGNGQATITVSAPGCFGVTGYKVTVNPGNITSSGPSPLVVSGLSHGTMYTATVSASNASGTGTSSPSGAFTPAIAPTAPVITDIQPGNGTATIGFAVSDDGGSPVTGYKLIVSPGGIIIPAKDSPVRIPNLQNGKAYSVQVCAENTWGEGPQSTPAWQFIPATIPDIPTIDHVDVGNGEAIVFVTSPWNGGHPIVKYNLVANPGNITATGDGSPVLLQGLANGTTYNVQVSASNDMGTSALSAPSRQFMPAPLPGAPIIEEVLPIDGVATVNFKMPEGSASQNMTYRVDAYEMNGSNAIGTGISITEPVFQSPILLKGLAWGKTYKVTVTATNSEGLSSTSALSEPILLQRATWVSYYPDDMLLTQLVFPGTHDSAAYAVSLDLGETQDWSIAEQLGNGIRFLDIRVANLDAGKCKLISSGYPFELRHGIECLGNFQTLVLDPVYQFLKDHPKEVILMSVSDEDTLDVPKFLEDVINQTDGGYKPKPISKFYTRGNNSTTLGDVRGKVVLFDRMKAKTGIPWNIVKTQDSYDLDNNCGFVLAWPPIDCSIDYPAKARKVIEFLIEASTNGSNNDYYWVNFASAQWKGIYIGNNAEKANAAVNDYFTMMNNLNTIFKINRFGSIILMDYPNRQGDKVINSILNFNRLAH